MKRGLIFSLILTLALVFTLSFVQAREIEWSNSYGTSSLDKIMAVEQTPDGGYVMVGYTNANPIGQTGQGKSLYIIKVDSSGSKEWDRIYGSAWDDSFYDVEVTSTSIIAVGYFGTNSNSWRPYAASFSYNGGSINWHNSYNIPGVSNSEALSLSRVSTFSSDFVITGRAGNDLLAFKINSGGNLINTPGWDFTPSSTSVGYFVEKLSSNSAFVIAGSGKIFTSSGSYLAVFRNDGGLAWEKILNNKVGTFLLSVEETSDRGFIVSEFSNPGVRVIKTDSSGSIVWEKVLDEGLGIWIGTKPTDGRSVFARETSDGGFIVSAVSTSFSDNGRDVYIVKLDSSGKLIWQQVYDLANNDITSMIKQTSDGGFIISGYSDGTSSGNGFLVKISDFTPPQKEIIVAGLCELTRVELNDCNNLGRLEFNQQGDINIGQAGSDCDVTCYQPFVLASSESQIWLDVLRNLDDSTITNPLGGECRGSSNNRDQFLYTKRESSFKFSSEENCWYKPTGSLDVGKNFEFNQDPLLGEVGVDCKVTDGGGLELCGVKGIDESGFTIHLQEDAGGSNVARNDDPIWYAVGEPEALTLTASPTNLFIGENSVVKVTTPDLIVGAQITFTTDLGVFVESGTNVAICTTIGSGRAQEDEGTCELSLTSSVVGTANVVAISSIHYDSNNLMITFDAGPTSCSGDIGFVFNPNPVDNATLTQAQISGLSSSFCDGKVVSLREGSSCSGNQVGSCSVSFGGCNIDITSPNAEGTYPYTACVDKNSDLDYLDSGETFTEDLVVSGSSTGNNICFHPLIGSQLGPVTNNYCFYDQTGSAGGDADKLLKCVSDGAGGTVWTEALCSDTCNVDADTGNSIGPTFDGFGLCQTQTQNPINDACENRGSAGYCYDDSSAQNCDVSGVLINHNDCGYVDETIYYCSDGSATAGCGLCDSNKGSGTSESICQSNSHDTCSDDNNDGECIDYTSQELCEDITQLNTCLDNECVWEGQETLCRACTAWDECWDYDNAETCESNPCGMWIYNGNQGSCKWQNNACEFVSINDAGEETRYTGSVEWEECVAGTRKGIQTIINSNGETEQIEVTSSCPGIIPLFFLTQETAIAIMVSLALYYFYQLNRGNNSNSFKYSRRKRR